MKKRGPTTSNKRKNNNSVKKTAPVNANATAPPLVRPPTTVGQSDQVTMEQMPEVIEQDEEEKQQVKEAIEKDKDVAKWMKTQVDAESKRLKKHGAKVSILNIKNTGIVRDEEDVNSVKNRVEANTNTNFDTVEQLLLSDPIPCTLRENHNYVNVILLTANGALLLPYVYPVETQNDLSKWIFINNSFQRTEFNIGAFTPISK